MPASATSVVTRNTEQMILEMVHDHLATHIAS